MAHGEFYGANLLFSRVACVYGLNNVKIVAKLFVDTVPVAISNNIYIAGASKQTQMLNWISGISFRSRLRFPLWKFAMVCNIRPPFRVLICAVWYCLGLVPRDEIFPNVCVGQVRCSGVSCPYVFRFFMFCVVWTI